MLLKISLVLFMVSSLLDLGLRLNLQEALIAIRNLRFVTLSLLWGYILLPATALVLVKVIPLAPPYAMGLLIMGMVPCAPFLPMMVDKARGDLSYTPRTRRGAA